MDTSTLIAFASEMMAVVAVTMLLGLAPRLSPLPIAFRFPKREAQLAFGIFVLLLILRFVPLTDATEAYLLPPLGEVNQAMLDALPRRLLLAWISLLPIGALLATRQYQQPFPSIGWNKRDTRLAFQLGLGLGLVALFIGGRFFTLFGGLNLAVLYSLIVWIGIGLCEETVFRGYMQPRFSAQFGANWGWVIAALLYTLWILPVFLGRPDLPVQVGVVLVRGLVLGWIFRKTGHTLAPALYKAISGWLLFI